MTKVLAIAGTILALLVGVVIGTTTKIADGIFGPSPQTIAAASLESMRSQNRLIAFVARYVSVVSTEENRLGGLLTSERTLVLPGDVRYELDLSKLQPSDVSWSKSSHTLRVRLPEIEITGPDVDINAARQFGQGGILSSLINAKEQLDQANRAKAVADLRNQAQGAKPMRLAHQAAREAIERGFAVPLLAAGFNDARVIARFPTEGSDEASYMDLSTPYEEAMKEAERLRAQGRK